MTSAQTNTKLLSLFEDLETGGLTSSNIRYNDKIKALYFRRVISVSQGNAVSIEKNDLIGFAIKHNKLRSLNYLLTIFDVPKDNLTLKERLCYYYLIKD